MKEEDIEFVSKDTAIANWAPLSSHWDWRVSLSVCPTNPSFGTKINRKSVCLLIVLQRERILWCRFVPMWNWKSPFAVWGMKMQAEGWKHELRQHDKIQLSYKNNSAPSVKAQHQQYPTFLPGSMRVVSSPPGRLGKFNVKCNLWREYVRQWNVIRRPFSRIFSPRFPHLKSFTHWKFSTFFLVYFLLKSLLPKVSFSCGN